MVKLCEYSFALSENLGFILLLQKFKYSMYFISLKTKFKIVMIFKHALKGYKNMSDTVFKLKLL